ncbi:DAPK1 [Symbiodinium sp. CCMP2592]|nr:DAPK1 [Symbiodinium sp. CCMP2592]
MVQGVVYAGRTDEQIEQLEAENQRLKAKLEDESSRHAVQTEELEASHRDALGAAAEQLESQRVAYVTQMEDMRQNLDNQYRQEQDALKAQEQEQNQRFQEELQQLRDREAAQRKRHEEQMMEFRGREEERQRKFQEDLGEAEVLPTPVDVLEISDTEEVEGINDYPRALEFQKSWIHSENYAHVLERVTDNVVELQSQYVGTSPPIQESMKLVRDLWMLTDQALANQNSYQCFNLCVLCEMSPEELLAKPLKTISVSRAKDYKDKLKMALIAPADAAGGLVTGVFAGLLTAGAFGTAGGLVAGEVTAEKIGPGFVSLMAGLISGAVTGAVVLPFAVADGKFLPNQPFANHFGANSYGLKSLRNAMDYNVSKYVDGFFDSNPDDLYKPDESSSEEVQNYKALSHCEYLRLRPFDIRHAILCARHSMLCGKSGGMLVAEAKDGQCAALSGRYMQDTLLRQHFQQSK